MAGKESRDEESRLRACQKREELILDNANGVKTRIDFSRSESENQFLPLASSPALFNLSGFSSPKNFQGMIIIVRSCV